MKVTSDHPDFSLQEHRESHRSACIILQMSAKQKSLQVFQQSAPFAPSAKRVRMEADRLINDTPDTPITPSWGWDALQGNRQGEPSPSHLGKLVPDACACIEAVRLSARCKSAYKI